MPRGSMWGWHQLIFALLKALIQVSFEMFDDYIQISMSNTCFATLLVYGLATCTIWPLVPYGRLQSQQVFGENWEVIYP